MQVSFAYTAQDYVEAQRAYQRHLASVGKRLLGTAMVLLGYIFLVIGIYLTFFGDDLSLTVFCLAYGGFVVLYYGPLKPSRFRRHFNRSRTLRGEKRAIIGEEGFEISGDFGESKLKWHVASRYTETPNLFVLLVPPCLFYMFPKRAFTDDEKDEFRRLLQQKIAPEKA